jgi:hypothetical protein
LRLVAADLERKKLPAGGHEPDWYDCPKRERDQQDAGEQAVRTATVMDATHVTMGS